MGLFALAESFRDALCERDDRCVITGNPALGALNGDWEGYTATPIFPLTHEQHWVTHGYDKWITIPGSSGSITSVQNGMSLRSDISTLFESYILAINPDASMASIFLRAPTTHNPLRTVTRSSSSGTIITAFLAPISIRPSLRIPNDPLISSYGGTLDRLYLRM